MAKKNAGSGSGDVHEPAVEKVKKPSPAEVEDADAAAEAAYYLETLRANRRIAGEGEPLGPGQTHRIEKDAQGRRVLRRKRFSAI